MSRPLPFLLLLVMPAVQLAGAVPAAAQAREFVGPGKCVDCHDHKDEEEWWKKRDGDGRKTQHYNALNQLADPNAAKYGKAIGLTADGIYEPKATCVKCHATVVRGSADFGIGCESCHGAGKDYLKPHQEKGTGYAAALPLGMKDVWKKPGNWVNDCLTCHVLGGNQGDGALVAAGHPSGRDFFLRTKFKPVAGHWTSKYTENQIEALAKPLFDTLARRLDASPAPAPAAPAPPAPTAPAAPATPVATTPPAASAPPPSPPPSGSKPSPTSTAPAVTTPTPSAERFRSTPPPAPPPAPPPPSAAPASGQPTIVQPPPDPDLPSTPAGMVASIQGRLAALLDVLLARGVKTPQRVTPPERKTAYRGADAELLRLQEEVIALGLEALGVAPAAKKNPDP